MTLKTRTNSFFLVSTSIFTPKLQEIKRKQGQSQPWGQVCRKQLMLVDPSLKELPSASTQCCL